MAQHPYLQIQDQKSVQPRNGGKDVVIRGVNFGDHGSKYIAEKDIDSQLEYYSFFDKTGELNVWYTKPHIEVQSDINDEVDRGVRFLNVCSDDEFDYNSGNKIKKTCWWRYPDTVPVRTMPADEDWDEVTYVDFKLAPGVFENDYALEAIDKFFNNKKPDKILHLCNQVKNNRDNFIEENLDIWESFVEHSYNATKKGRIWLEVFMYFNTKHVINPEKTHIRATDADCKWATEIDPVINKEHIKNINFDFYDHVDYYHCLTHQEIIYFNLKNFTELVDETGIYVPNLRKYWVV